MRTKHKIVYFLTVTLGVMSLFAAARAAAPATLALNTTTGDGVQIQVTGDINSNVQLSFLPPGASTVTSFVFGTTDGNGNFSTTISSGGYGIPAGSPVFVTVNGMQSPTTLWPTYTSSLILSQTNVQIAVGQSSTITASNALILAANSLGSNLTTSVSGSQVTITGLAAGSGTLTFCAVSAGCKALAVTVGATAGQTQISFSNNNITLNIRETKSVTIFGGSRNGYTVASNSNPNSVTASISGTSSLVWLYGTDNAGTTTIVICSVESGTNCANLNVTNLNSSPDALTFSQNNLSLIPGLAQNVTVSGGPDTNYYISSNSNSGVVGASLSGATLTVNGGANAGTAAIIVCSTTVNATCGTLNVTTNINSATPSATVLVFSQNVVSVAQGDTSTVTVTGGTGMGYVISSNSNPASVTPSINGTSNVITLFGTATGSSIITVCSAASGTTCSSLYVNVGPALVAIYFSQNNLALSTGHNALVTITGGTGTGYTISSNNNPNAVAASLSGGNVVVLTGGSVSGSAVITICSATYNTNCANLYASTTASAASKTRVASSQYMLSGIPDGSLIKGSGASLYYYYGGRRFVFANDKTYKSWYSDFSGVRAVSDSDLASVPLSGNVTYRAGIKMVKITTDPKVYAVDKGGVLRWIKSEAIAVALYGANWNKMIDDVPDAFFANYTLGADINSTSDFNPSAEQSDDSTIATDFNL